MADRAWYELGPFTVFDVETTGMSPVKDRIVEIAAIRIDADGEQTRFQSLINPGLPIPAAASQVHRITDDMVSGAPFFTIVAREFIALAQDSTLVAHNARFDLGFLQESLYRCGLETWKGKTMDSLTLMKNAYAGLPSYSLQNLRRSFSLDDSENATAHRAGADVEWTLQILSLALKALLRQTVT